MWGGLLMRNLARVSLVALKRALGVKEARLLGDRRSTWGDWCRGPLNLFRRRHLCEALLCLYLSGALRQRRNAEDYPRPGLRSLGPASASGGSAGPKLWAGIRHRASVRCTHWLGPGAAAATSLEDVDADDWGGRIVRLATHALSWGGSTSTFIGGFTSS